MKSLDLLFDSAYLMSSKRITGRWRNWHTQQTQNLSAYGLVGSSPTLPTKKRIIQQLNITKPMDKTIMEKAIRNRAEMRFKKEFDEAKELIAKNSFLSSLKVSLRTEDGKGYSMRLSHERGQDGLIPFSYDGESKDINFKEIKEETIEKYEKEELDQLLEQIGDLQYLFDNQ